MSERAIYAGITSVTDPQSHAHRVGVTFVRGGESFCPSDPEESGFNLALTEEDSTRDVWVVFPQPHSPAEVADSLRKLADAVETFTWRVPGVSDP